MRRTAVLAGVVAAALAAASPALALSGGAWTKLPGKITYGTVGAAGGRLVVVGPVSGKPTHGVVTAPVGASAVGKGTLSSLGQAAFSQTPAILNGEVWFERYGDAAPSLLRAPIIGAKVGAPVVVGTDLLLQTFRGATSLGGATYVLDASSETLVVGRVDAGVLTLVDLTSLLKPGFAINGAAIGADAAGRLIVAYTGGGTGQGVYAVELDPATLQPRDGAAPARAPGSSNGGLALACAATCRLVYGSAEPSPLSTWALGDARPVVLRKGGVNPGGFAAAYDASGRLWVAYIPLAQSTGTPLTVVRGDARGAPKQTVKLPGPGAGGSIGSALAGMAIVGGKAVVVAPNGSGLSALVVR